MFRAWDCIAREGVCCWIEGVEEERSCGMRGERTCASHGHFTM
jgi:hypothetical protein